MPRQDEQERRWLIKSAARVLGPFTIEEIVDRVQRRELGSVDEVSRPFSRWHYIREIPELEEALRAGADPGAETTANVPREETITTKTDRERELIKDAIPAPETASDPIVYTSEQFKTTHRWTFALYLTVFLVVALSVYWYRSFNSVSSTDFDRLFATGSKAFEAGDYNTAIENLEYARRANPNNLEALYYLSLSHAAERHVVIARRLFDELSNLDTTSKYRLDRIIGESVISSDSENLDLAQEKLEIAFAEAPRNGAVLNNLAVVYFKKGEVQKAQDILRKALEADVFEPEHYILLAHIDLKSGIHSPGILDKLLAEPVKALKNRVRLGQDVEIVRMYWSFRRWGRKPTGTELQALLDEDLLVSGDHRRNPLWIHDFTGFTKIKPWCDELAALLDDAVYRAVLTSYCQFRMDMKQEASRVLDPHLNQPNPHPMVLAYRAYLDWDSGRFDEAAAGAELSRKENPSLVLPMLVRGRICFDRGDDTCAHEAWQRALMLRSYSLTALAGMGALGDQESLAKAQHLAPEYRPLIDVAKRNLRRGK